MVRATHASLERSFRTAGTVLAALGGSSIVLSGCLGHGTARIDAPCREMRSAVVYEMLRDNPSIPVVDVRKVGEVTEEEGRLARSIEVPFERLPIRFSELERYRDTTVIVLGRDGEAGKRACQYLSGRGFKYVIFVSDGAEGWHRNGLPSGVPRRPTPTPSPAAERIGG